MKRTSIGFFCMLICSILSYAQEVRTDTLVPVQRNWISVPVNHWSVEIQGGVNNYLMSPPAPTTVDRYNLSLGGAIEYTFNPLVGLGLAYSNSDYSRPYIYNGSIGSLKGASNDLLLFSSVNLSNVLSPYRDGFWRKLSFYGNVGAGVAYFGGNLDGAPIDNQFALMGKLGLSAEVRLSKLLSLSLDGKYHQYDALNMGGGSRSNRNGDALMLMLGLRFKFGSGLHARNIDMCTYAPKIIPVVSKTTFVKGESPKTKTRILAVEQDNESVKQRIQLLEDNAKALIAKKAALSAAEKAALQIKLEEKDKAAAAMAKKLRQLEEKARLDSLAQVKELAKRADELAKRAEELSQLSARDSVTANKLKKMEEDLKNLATQEKGTVNLTLENVQFKSGSNILLPSSFVMLDQVAGILKTNTQWKSLKVTGHTDNVGAEVNNLRLSQSRAAAVKKYLVSKGILASKIVSIGLGESLPISENATPEGRQQNRRVEFEIK